MKALLGCVVDEPARVGLPAATLRAIAAKNGPEAALEQVAHRVAHPVEWIEGVVDRYTCRDELTIIVPFIGYATTARPLVEADKEQVKGELAGLVLGLYLDALDVFEGELAKTQANLAEHLRPRSAPVGDEAPAPVAPLPAGGLRDLFTGEARMPVYSDDPPAERTKQRRLF